MAFNLKYKNVKRSGSNGRFTLGTSLSNTAKTTGPLRQNKTTGPLYQNGEETSKLEKRTTEAENLASWEKIFAENPKMRLNLEENKHHIDYSKISADDFHMTSAKAIPSGSLPDFNPETDVTTYRDAGIENPTSLNPTRQDHTMIRGYYFDKEKITPGNPKGKTYYDEEHGMVTSQVIDEDGNMLVNNWGGGDLYEQNLQENNPEYYNRLAEFANYDSGTDQAKNFPHVYGPSSNAAIILKRTGRTGAQMEWFSKEEIENLPPGVKKEYYEKYHSN